MNLRWSHFIQLLPCIMVLTRALPTGWQSTSFPRMQHSGLQCRRGWEGEFPVWGFGPPFLPSYFLQPCQCPFCVPSWDTNSTSTYSYMAQWALMPGWPYALFANAGIRRNRDLHKLGSWPQCTYGYPRCGWLVLCRITYFITFYSWTCFTRGRQS